jgi:hypothetical protein
MAQRTDPDTRLLNTAEMEATYGGSALAWRRRAERGQCPAMRVGRRWYFDRVLVDAWILRKSEAA